jgi:hypothetical protein
LGGESFPWAFHVFAFSIAHAQVNSDAYRDYFLIGQFGEVCTLWEAVVLCEARQSCAKFSGQYLA